MDDLESHDDGGASPVAALKILAQNFKLFEELKIQRQHRYLIFELDNACVKVGKIGAREETFEDFARNLSSSMCRYCLYDQEIVTEDKRQKSKLWLISWMPYSSSPHSKMSYTSARKSFTAQFTGTFDVQCGSVREIEQYFGQKIEQDDVEEEFEF